MQTSYTKNSNKTKEYKEEDGSTTYVTDSLHFKKEAKCNHKFVRKTSTRIECVKCFVGFFDSGDFPLEEMNEYYNKNIDPD